MRPDTETVQAHAATLAMDVAARSESGQARGWSNQLREVVAVTAVGPARTGSTLAILADLIARNMCIVGLSVASLQEVAVITAYLGVGPAVEGAEFQREVGDLSRVLGVAASRSALTQWQGRTTRKSQLTRALDYRMVMSGPFSVRETNNESVPFWIAWNTKSAVGVPIPLPEIVVELLIRDPLVVHAEVSYARARRVDGSGLVRGRAKISIMVVEAFKREGLSGWLGEKAEACERLVRKDPRVAGTDTQVRVAWREKWLGAASEAPL